MIQYLHVDAMLVSLKLLFQEKSSFMLERFYEVSFQVFGKIEKKTFKLETKCFIALQNMAYKMYTFQQHCKLISEIYSPL